MEQLAHAVANRDIATFASGPEPTVEGTDGGVVLDAAARSVPKVRANQIVAFAGHDQRAWGQGLAALVDAGAAFLGKDAEVVDQVVGRGEAIDVHDLGHQRCGGGFANAGDGEDLDVR